ncbi:DUF6895 family protein [Streptomyces sp. SBT349]|uniref:DUF6895 family protein n=1 Tax=Streptomyces sp. SBT349 TaxID=1580539 RepID=UPI00066EE6E8|nr:hypothetical protein [Streptomyces sp. SBT349]
MDATTVRRAQQVADRALAWLARMQSSFAFPPDVPDQEVNGETLKSLGELALAASIVRRAAVAGPDTARTAQELLDFAWRQFRAGDLLYELQRYTPAATYPLEIYVRFAGDGYRHAALEELVAHLTELRAARCAEQLPHRRLGVAAARRELGLPSPTDLAGEAGHTWLGGMPEPWMLDAGNAYGVTHAVFHLTNWGADPGGLPPALADYLELWLPVWVEVFTETRTWDLLGEFLMVGMCVARPVWYPRVWERLAAAQRPDGMLPNGFTRPADDPELAFRNHSHPTIVAVAAGTLTVSRALDPAPSGAARAGA